MSNVIGRRIKERRTQLNMSQEELAKKMGYSTRTTVYKIEAGINDVSVSKVEAFAKALDATPEYIAGWSSKA